MIQEIFSKIKNSPDIKPETVSSSNRNPITATIEENVFKTIERQRELANDALSDPLKKYPICIVGGESFDILVLGIQGLSCFASFSGISNLLTGCGVFGALFNFAEGAQAIKEGLHAWNQNRTLAVRLLAQGALMIGLGSAMLTLSIGQIVSATAITAFFAANPYILPSLLFLLSLFLLAETMHRLYPVIQGNDLGAKLQLNELKTFVKDSNRLKNWVYNKLGVTNGQQITESLLTHKFKLYKEEIGFTAAEQAFALFKDVLEEKTDISYQIEQLEKSIANRTTTLYLKVGAVALAMTGFGLGLGAAFLNSNLLDGIQNFITAGSVGVSLHLDIFEPFEREVPIVIPFENEEEEEHCTPPFPNE